jgi:hypothetical protein
MAQSNLTIKGERAWSYSTALRDTLPDGRVVMNVTKYSVTTSKHQTYVVRHFGNMADIWVSDVPMGTADLAGYVTRRGLA